jgi:hypothetical protein
MQPGDDAGDVVHPAVVMMGMLVVMLVCMVMVVVMIVVMVVLMCMVMLVAMVVVMVMVVFPLLHAVHRDGDVGPRDAAFYAVGTRKYYTGNAQGVQLFHKGRRVRQQLQQAAVSISPAAPMPQSKYSVFMVVSSLLNRVCRCA